MGEEIVRALTVAPEGAPEWASDPAQLWNRAEAAERRKDAQVARDYRIPIPFGLTDQQAGDMAESMARFIADELSTAVSLGLHRDGELDALGAPKPADRQGYHAHLYFPTRKLAALEEGGGEGTSSTGLGSKLVLLSNKRTSADFVERLNQKWAELANGFTAAHNLPADYDNRSYVRQGLPITPQPTLGQTVTAMERRGFFTRRGDVLRDIVVPSEIYKTAHAVVLDAQREQAVADVAREAGVPMPALPPSHAELPGSGAPAEPTPEVSGVPPGWAPAPPRAVSLPDGSSLMARFEAALPVVPVTPEAREVFNGLLKLVLAIDRVLRALTSLASKLMRHEEDTGRRVTAQLDTRYEIDQARKERAAARERVTQWEADHPWRLLAALTLKGGGDPPEWLALTVEVARLDRHVQSLKQTLQTHRASLDDLGEQEEALKVLRTRAKDQLERAVGAFVELGATWIPTLVGVVPEEERKWLEAALPAKEIDKSAQAKVADQLPDRMAMRLRPTPRP